MLLYEYNIYVCIYICKCSEQLRDTHILFLMLWATETFIVHTTWSFYHLLILSIRQWRLGQHPLLIDPHPGDEWLSWNQYSFKHTRPALPVSEPLTPLWLLASAWGWGSAVSSGCHSGGSKDPQHHWIEEDTGETNQTTIRGEFSV